jgi:hypothetical protein
MYKPYPFFLTHKPVYVPLKYHMVFDNKFTAASVSHHNVLPSNWDQLFSGYRVSCLEGEPQTAGSHNTLSHEWQDTSIQEGV